MAYPLRQRLWPQKQKPVPLKSTRMLLHNQATSSNRHRKLHQTSSRDCQIDPAALSRRLQLLSKRTDDLEKRRDSYAGRDLEDIRKRLTENERHGRPDHGRHHHASTQKQHKSYSDTEQHDPASNPQNILERLNGRSGNESHKRKKRFRSFFWPRVTLRGGLTLVGLL